ncbi:MAG: FtsX-like permease family protein [Gemmatimonadetes bacterium]|jgi:predicted lysophospholipase L1 biosynthesis ABC-type transport system permease subunit|nr:FtsX-like permease family protein [Gemmatimonadota bacterium]MDE0961799.1 FtsX-like permease family protein [Candidatus Latescibacterota bacterium]MBT5324729.1 FtsX-like permease family protein [Gemmatimonadota bacterium]MBT5450096.1 FtsX-like permease family protein [Gemmatimonadota bacterium]MBT5800458.1 FtsX-like permease family protein [Gemmatimonadota bacterium]
MSEKRLAGGREIVLPMSKAVEISFRSLKIRFGRSLITTSGVILAIAFLMSVWSSNAIVGSLRDVNKSEINLLLQKNGIETGLAESGEASAEAQARMLEEESKQTWLISLSLLVCVVGIANAMLMSVTERFREIGTMKCLGALDSFIVKLFLLESTFQGFAGTTAGIIIGFALTFLLALLDYGGYVLDYFPLNNIAESAGYALVVGTSLSLIGAMLPAYRAAKMEPVEAMRSDT